MALVKKELLWLFYYTGLIVIVASVWNYLHNLLGQWSREFSFGPFYMYGLVTAFIIGLYLSIPHLVKQYNVKGEWSYNFFRLVLVGLPTFILAVLSLGIFNWGIPSLLFRIIKPLILEGFELGLVPATIFGFVVFTSIYKKPVKVVD